jgi:hypothetical protein
LNVEQKGVGAAGREAVDAGADNHFEAMRESADFGACHGSIVAAESVGGSAAVLVTEFCDSGPTVVKI